MAGLPKSAQDFVRFLFSLKPLLQELRTVAADNLFPGLTIAITTLLPLFPIFRDAVGATAKAIADLSIEAATLVASPMFAGDLQALMAQNVITIRQMGTASINFADALRHIMVAAIPLQNWLGESAVRLSEWVRNAAQAGRESGAMAEFFERTRAVLERLFSIFRNLGETILNVTKAGRELGNGLLESFDRITKGWANWTGSVRGQNVLREFYDQAREPLHQIGLLIRDIAKGFGQLGGDIGLADVISQIRTQFLPALVELSATTGKVFTRELIDTATSFVQLFARLSSETGALTLFIDLLGRMAAVIVKIADTVPGFIELVTGLAIFRTVIAAIKLGGFITGLSSLPSLFTTVAAGARTLWAVLLANPWVALGAAIIALVILVVKNWDTIKEKTRMAWDFVKEHMDVVMRAILAILTGGLSELVRLVVRNWDSVQAKTSEVWNSIRSFLSGIWEGMKSAATGTWNGIRAALEGIWNGLRETATNVFSALKGSVEGIWNGLRSAASAIWNGIKDAVMGPINAMRSGVESVVNAVVGAFRRMVDGIVAQVSRAVAAIKKLPFVPGSPIPMVVWAKQTAKGVTEELEKLAIPRLTLSDVVMPGFADMNRIMGAIPQPALAVAPGTSGSVSNYYLTINVPENIAAFSPTLPRDIALRVERTLIRLKEERG
jgi:phage-related protein